MVQLQPSQVYETFTVWIEDAKTGKPLPEYNVEKKGDEVTCYIPSENDMGFKVRVKVDKTDRALGALMKFDGQDVLNRLFGEYPRGRALSSEIDALDGGAGKHIPLRFGVTQVAPDGTQDEKLCNELGEIKITAEICGKLTPKAVGWHPMIKTHQTYDLDSIHPLKVHSAKYIIEPTNNRPQYYDDEGPTVVGIFIFRYRSKTSLSLMNIIPKCIPDGVDVEKDDLSQVDPETKERFEELKLIARNVKHHEKKNPGWSDSIKASANRLSRIFPRKSSESKRPPWNY